MTTNTGINIVACDFLIWSKDGGTLREKSMESASGTPIQIALYRSDGGENSNSLSQEFEVNLDGHRSIEFTDSCKLARVHDTMRKTIYGK